MNSSSYRKATLEWDNGILTFSNVRSGPVVEAILTKLNGWFGGVGVKGEEQERLGHGAYLARKHRGTRSLTLEATLIFEDEQARNIGDRYVSGILDSGTPGVLTVATGDLELSTEVVLAGEIDHDYVGRNAVRIQIPLKAPDPNLYGPAKQYQLFPAGAGTGLEYGLFKNGGILTYGRFVQNSQVVVKNNGNTDAYPIFVTQGDFPSGVSINDGNGHTVELNTPILAASPVTFDMRGSATRNGSDISYLLTRRNWFSIPPGESMQPAISSIQEGSGFVDITLQDTYL